MKLVNSNNIKTIDKYEHDNLFVDDEHQASSCWEAKVDNEQNKIIFLIDSKEILSGPLSNLKLADLTIEKIGYFIKLLKTGKLNKLRKEIKVRK